MRLLAVVFVVLTLLLPTPASAQDGPCIGRWNTHRQVRQGITCVWERFSPGYGGASKAIEVATCESGLRPEADGGINAGLFQHNLNYWSGRYENYIADHDRRSTWGLSPSAYSGRTNAIVTALMVRRGGWGPWSCA